MLFDNRSRIMDRQKGYWGMGIKEFFNKKIYPIALMVAILILVFAPFVSASPLYTCYDNFTLQKNIDISVNETSIGIIIINETCPFYCFENITSKGASCGPSPMELAGISLAVIFIMFAIMYGWARLTYKKRRGF